MKLISSNIMFFYVTPAEILEGIWRKLKKKQNKDIKPSVKVFQSLALYFLIFSGLITVEIIFIDVYNVFCLNTIWWIAKWCMEVRIPWHAFVYAYVCKHISGQVYIQHILNATIALNLNRENLPPQSRIWGFYPFCFSTKTGSVISRASVSKEQHLQLCP